jgi:hypothetical protein
LRFNCVNRAGDAVFLTSDAELSAAFTDAHAPDDMPPLAVKLQLPENGPTAAASKTTTTSSKPGEAVAGV